MPTLPEFDDDNSLPNFSEAALPDFGLSTAAKVVGTIPKAAYALNEGIVRAGAGTGTAIARLVDPGPRRRSYQEHVREMDLAGARQITPEQASELLDLSQEIRRGRLTAPGLAFAGGAEDAANEFHALREGTPGYEAPAKAAEFVGGALPFVAEAAIPGVGQELAAVHGGLESGGATWQQAYEYYRGQGLPEEQAKAKADEVAARTGMSTAGVFRLLPGAGNKVAADIVGDRLLTKPLLRALARTAVASGEGGTVMAADTAQRLLQAEGTYRPDLTLGEATREIGQSFAAGAAAGALTHAPGELGRLKFPDEPPTKPDTVSEFGGEADLPPPEAESVPEFETPPPTDQPPVANAEPEPNRDVKESAAETKTVEPDVFEEVQTSGKSEPAEDVEPLSTMERKYLAEDITERRRVNATLVERAQADGGFALPEGYALEGKDWVFTEPAKAETPTARMAREQREAMDGLRATRASEPPYVPTGVTPPARAERAEAGMPLQTFERPPDVLDDIEGHVGGVAIPQGEDFAGIRDEVKGLSQSKAADLGRAKLKKLFNGGTAPDRALNALHREGLHLDIHTGGELLDRMVRDARSRLAWAEQEKEAARYKPAAEKETNPDVDPWQATIEKLNSMKVDTNGQLHAFGLLPEAWNLLIDLAKVGVKTGRTVAEAIDWAIGEIKRRYTDPFDEAGARAHLLANLNANPAGMDPRATGEKIAGSAGISPETKAAVTEYLYQSRSNANDQETADGLVKQFGVDQATEIYRDPPATMPGAVRSKLLGSITRSLALEERVARSKQNAGAADALADKQAKLWNEALPQITDMAQSLQALNDLISMSPDGHVARVRRRIDEVANQEIDVRRPEVEQARTALEQGRAAGVEAVRHDPAVNAAARAAVDATIAKDPEIHKAVIMDMAAPWSESPEIVQMAREQVRAKADELLNKSPRPPELTPREHLRTIMDDLAKRAAGIAANYFQGVAVHAKGLSGLLQERLGLDQSHADRLAKSLDKEFDAQVKVAKAKLPKRIAAARVTRDRNSGATLESPDNAVDAAIRRQLRELNLKLGDVLKQQVSQQDSSARHVAERIVRASGLVGEAADVLRNRLESRWNALVTAAQQRALRTLQAKTGVSMTRPMRDAFAKAVELERLGALNSEQFYDVVKKSLKLKHLTDADAKALRQLVQRAQEQPEGFLRQRAAADVIQFTERLTGGRRWWDVPMAIFYANILSGFTTPAKILFENTNLLVGNTLTEFLSQPSQNVLHPVEFTKQLARAYGRGLAKGALQGEGTLRTGVITGVWHTGRSNILEAKPFGRFEPLNFWKYFTRVIGTAHETTFKPAWEMKQTMIARDVARREGLTGKALDQRVADLLANTDEVVAKAKGQALAELGAGANRFDLARRTREILEQQREVNMPGSTETARDYALRTAYLNEPYGYLGLIATTVRSALEKGRKEFPLVGTIGKTQIPFTTVVANILNEKLNWTPVGAFRAAASRKTGKLYGRPIMSSNERAQLYAKAITGTIAFGVLGTLFGNHIHGNGPAAPQKRKQLQAAGWIPHSIELNGRYYSYMNTPLALSLAVLGNWLDWHRYGKGEDADGVSRAAFAAKATANAIVSQGMLDSVHRLFEALGNESTSEGADKLEKLTARTATSFVVPNLVQQLDRLFDPTVYDQSGMGALLKSQVPFVRRDNKPALNVLGEPVQVGPFHYWASKQTEDPIWRFLAEKQAFIPEPDKNAIIGSRKLGPDYYRAITADEYYDLISESGPRIRGDLEKLLPILRTQSPEEVQAVVKMIADKEHQAAKAKLQ